MGSRAGFRVLRRQPSTCASASCFQAVGGSNRTSSPSTTSTLMVEITGRVNATQGFRDVQAARRTIQGYEAMHMIRKGHARWVSGSAVRQQMQCIHHLFEVAA